MKTLPLPNIRHLRTKIDELEAVTEDALEAGVDRGTVQAVLNDAAEKLDAVYYQISEMIQGERP